MGRSRAVSVLAKTSLGDRPAVDSLTLDSRSRRRRRFRFTTDSGRELLLDLPRAPVLRDGDGLLLENGGWVRVRAAAEDVLEIRADSAVLARIAWHLGNRHTPAEIGPETIHIEHDHVLEQMVKGLGADVRAVRRVFEPEGGAYAGHEHGHPAHDDEGHA